jgi:hypothetical protein
MWRRRRKHREGRRVGCRMWGRSYGRMQNCQCFRDLERISDATHRMRKWLTMEPSTPVMKEGPISHGKVVEVGFFVGRIDEDGWGTSNEICAIAS